jgi:hypothetical protein
VTDAIDVPSWLDAFRDEVDECSCEMKALRMSLPAFIT